MVAVGDKVEADQSLIAVEGDKASMEVPAPFAGVVKEIKVKAGDKVSTGSLIMVFEVAGAAPPQLPRLLRLPPRSLLPLLPQLRLRLPRLLLPLTSLPTMPTYTPRR